MQCQAISQALTVTAATGTYYAAQSHTPFISICKTKRFNRHYSSIAVTGTIQPALQRGHYRERVAHYGFVLLSGNLDDYFVIGVESRAKTYQVPGTAQGTKIRKQVL